MSNFLLIVKRLRDASLDLYSSKERRQVPVEKSDLWAIVEDWARLDSAYRAASLELISLKDRNQTLLKDAERFDFIAKDAESGLEKIYGDDWLAVVDSMISSKQ